MLPANTYSVYRIHIPVDAIESGPAVHAGALSRHAAEPGSLYGTSVFWDEYAAGKVGPAASPGGVFC